MAVEKKIVVLCDLCVGGERGRVLNRRGIAPTAKENHGTVTSTVRRWKRKSKKSE